MEQQGRAAKEGGAKVNTGRARRRRLAVSPALPLSLVVALWLLASACGLPGLLPQAEPADNGQGTPNGPAGVLPRVAKPPRPRVLRMPITAPGVLDPGTATNPAALDLLSALFEPLASVDSSGAAQEGNAERWQIGPDGTSYRFSLREGLRWSDGAPLTADDYVWAWRRNIAPRTGAGYAPMLYPIRNAREIHAGKLDPSTLGVRAVDERTLEVTLAAPDAAFLSLVSRWVYLPLPKHVLEGTNAAWTDPTSLVGNGPYRVASWSPNQQVILEPNLAYAGPHGAQLERIELQVFPSNGEAAVLQAYEAGQLDTTGTHFQLPGSALQQITATPELAQQLVDYDLSATSFVIVNLRKPYLQDTQVRRALGMALDRAELVREALGTAAVPARSLQPPGVGGRDPQRWPGEDISEARRLLAQAGYPDGKGFPALRYTYTPDPVDERVAQYLKRRWQETLGITLRLEAMDWRAFIAWRRSGTWDREGDLYRGSWMSEVEEPTVYYRTLWAAQGDEALLRSGWRNKQFEALVGEAASEIDPQRRAELYRQAEGALAQDYPGIPLYDYRGQMLVKPYVHGFAPQRILGLTPWTALQIGQD